VVEGLTWAQVMQNIISTNNANERYVSESPPWLSFRLVPNILMTIVVLPVLLIARIKEILNFHSVSESERFISGYFTLYSLASLEVLFECQSCP
jgi:hypothetical protein